MPKDNKKSKKKLKIVTVVLAVIVVLFTGCIWYVQDSYKKSLLPVSSDTQTSIVTIQTGSTTAEVAELLEQRGLIKDSRSFEWYVRTHGDRDKIQAGSYALSPSYGVKKIVDMITNGKVAVDLVTILPGQRLDQIQTAFVDSFAQYGYDKTTVLAAFDPAQYINHPVLADKPAGASLEGYLYPESFQRTASTSPITIIKSSLDQMQTALTTDVQAGFAKQGLSLHQAIILASIVEKEVSNVDDKPKVAQVFIKRLKMNMALGSDVTAYYGAEVAGLTRSVFTDTPYNTRIHSGLPPGPISNVTASSLKAVANPATTDFVYFVAGDDGITYFSKTLAEHEALTKLHCKKLCEE